MKITSKEQFVEMLREQNAPEFEKNVCGKKYHYIGSKKPYEYWKETSRENWIPVYYRCCGRFELNSDNEVEANTFCWQNNTSYRYCIETGKLLMFNFDWEEVKSFNDIYSTLEEEKIAQENYIADHKEEYVEYCNRWMNKWQEKINAKQEEINILMTKMEKIDNQVKKASN